MLSYYYLALTNFDFLLLGPVELAAVGVSISVFNLVSKMFNVPLLNVTTSFVAEDASQESAGVDILTKSRDSESATLLSADRKIFTIFSYDIYALIQFTGRYSRCSCCPFFDCLFRSF